MSFLHAGLLAAGLGAVSIPILIHLLMRRRRKPVEWGAMRFLLEAYKRTRRRLLIERWVLLALRCLLVAAAAVAIGRPLLGGGASGGAGGGVGTVYLVIDNSLASGALVGGESALKRHVAGAIKTLSLMSDGDRAGLVLLGAPADPLVVPPSANLGSVREQVERVRGTESRADLAGALGAVGSSIADERARDPRAAAPDRTVVVVLSDVWRGSADLESALPRLPGGVRLLVSESGREADVANVTVASAAARRGLLLPDQPDRAPVVTAVLRRSGVGVEREQVSKVVLRAHRRAGGGAGVAGVAEGVDEPVPV
ncbi:MAG: BatA domain-containing protein, partial [Phycisphaerae bacterium]|nr:BatA domain-containing protein [Phycisphaerae bacterium]